MDRFDIVNGWLIVTWADEWGKHTHIYKLDDNRNPHIYRFKGFLSDKDGDFWHMIAKQWAFDHDPVYPQSSQIELTGIS